MVGISFGHRDTSSNKTYELGSLLWHDDGKGAGPALCFLMEIFDSRSRNKDYFVGFIELGVSALVRSQHCQPADWRCTESLNLTGIVCSNPEWGAGLIVEQPNFGTSRWSEIIVALPTMVSNGRPPQIRTNLSEVKLRFFGQRPPK